MKPATTIRIVAGTALAVAVALLGTVLAGVASGEDAPTPLRGSPLIPWDDLLPGDPTNPGEGGEHDSQTVVMIGDSLTHQAGAYLHADFDDAGYELILVGGGGQDPLYDQGVWVNEWTVALGEADDPDVAIIEACGNYANGGDEYRYIDETGEPVEPDSPEMYRIWEDHVAAMIDVAHEAGVDEVYLVYCPHFEEWAPGLEDSEVDFEYRVDALNAIYVDLAAEYATGIIDWQTPVEGADEVVRAWDGVHFNDTGNELIANVTVETVDAGAA